MLSYILEVTLCLAAFYFLYALALSRETFFGINRWYLLGTLLLSLVIPIMPALMPSASPEITIAYTLEPVIIGIQDFSTMFVTTPATPWWLTALIALYWMGVLVMAFRFLLNLRSIWTLYQKSDPAPQRAGFPVILITDAELPFSFFNYIFIPRKHNLSQDALDEIIRHESAHSSAWHSIDILTMEFVSIFLWPSPMIYFYRKSMRRVHEYLADAVVLQNTPVKQYGHLLLSQTIPGMQLGLANHFFNNQLKQRIIMMTKRKSHQGALMKYAAFLPVLLITIALFAFRSQPDHTPWNPELNVISKDTVPSGDQDVYQVVEEMPRFPGCEESGLKGDDLYNCSMQKMLENFYSELKYPAEAKKAGVEGRTIAQFIVRRDGSITDATIVRSIGHGTDEVVLDRINAMPKWRPGYQKGEAVDVQFTIPVVFKLDPKDSQEKEESTHEDVFKVVENMPRYAGCEDSESQDGRVDACTIEKLVDYIQTNLKYPEEAKKASVEGASVVEFVVASDGKIKQSKIVKSLGYGTDEIVLGIVNNMPAWIPGTQGGKAVNVQMTLPITFALPKSNEPVKHKPEGVDKATKDKSYELEVFPNPSNDRITYRLNLPESADEIVIDLVNAQGQSVHQEVNTTGSGKGELSDTIEPEKLLPGSYVLRVIVNGQVISRSVVVQ